MARRYTGGDGDVVVPVGAVPSGIIYSKHNEREINEWLKEHNFVKDRCGVVWYGGV
jgi:hypothetical protein